MPHASVAIMGRRERGRYQLAYGHQKVDALKALGPAAAGCR